MPDGTTAIQVSPITEDDMNRVHSILTRAIDAVVGMSQLQKDVQALQTQIHQMSDDLDIQRRRNNALEEGLEQSRKARQEAESRISEAQQRAITAENSLDAARRDADHYMTTSNGLLDQVAKLKRERDDAQYSALEVSEKLATLEKKFASLKDLFGGSDPAPAVQAPSPQVSPPPAPVDVGEPRTTEAPKTEPAPTSGDWMAQTNPLLDIPTKPVRHYLDSWQAGAMWDSEKSQYYTEN